jgi:hypothetical protein
MKRNLIFYMYPVKGSNWRWHVERLLEYQHAWNGRRIVTVALGDATESRDVVAEALKQFDAEISFERNSGKLGETKFFVEALGMLRSENQGEATFYAHAKGVTRTPKEVKRISGWLKALYVLNLESIPAVERALDWHCAAGAFRHALQHAGSSRCFAGTFFWLKHSDLFSRDWRKINLSFYGVESYPGMHFKWDELYSWTPDNLGPTWLYEGGVTEGLIEKWKSYWTPDMFALVGKMLNGYQEKA